MRHAGRRFVEQHHHRVERERGRDLQRTLAAIGELARLAIGIFRQRHVLQQRPGAVVVAAQHRIGAPEVEGATALALQGQLHVLQHRQMREHGRDLE
jgi:hypothetical protein